VNRRLLLASLVALAPSAASCRRTSAFSKDGQGARVVSLAPSITETLFAIGAGSHVVAVSDYCDSPEQVKGLPRLGTGLTPNYEGIARLAPTLIVTEANASARRRELEAIGPTRLLPWLSLSEICGSIRELGRLTATTRAADSLSERILVRLNVAEPVEGPRVLLVLGGESPASDEIWFVRKNSLHGAALHAAGARNAVPEAVNGPPQLAHERLLALDPDAILVLAKPRQGIMPSRQSVTSLSRFTTLRAVRASKIELLEAPEAFANGPRILGLVDKLHASLRRLGVLP